MNRLIKNLIVRSVGQFFSLQLHAALSRRPASDTVHVVDIDNTLAHTWPSLCDGYCRSEMKRYESLSIFRGMRDHILAQAAAGHSIIFVSARSYDCYFLTRRWLRDCGVPFDQLILVYHVKEKLDFINLLLKKGKKVVYIDDLSYNHEAGETKFYEDTIRRVKQLPIRYIGAAEIEQINYPS
ncbi:hypothetical protein [Pedobacter sp. SYP-B3415]|uniref:hypothetical protein n=1 Tax=Pedobacter sp. SYP-B3415 TaxID=2496641 RepID=UPI00101C2F07|nr:hypothetical protein [Pedobacter sp. SYP-B3415]